MESKDELKEIDIKNGTCYYFDYIITDRDIYSDDILLDEKLYETYKNILIYNISYKIILIMILEKSELIHIILYQLKKYWVSIIL